VAAPRIVPRIVLDTNVLLSALLFPAGSVSWLRHAWQADDVRPLVSRATAAELLRVLAYPKFRLSAAEQEDLLADYLPWCETVIVGDAIEVPDCRDLNDRPFLALALAAGADALVTGDGDLPGVGGDTFAIPILTPATLRTRLRR
jgi:putative PIN family toxin of toxin-antitoxin system